MLRLRERIIVSEVVEILVHVLPPRVVAQVKVGLIEEGSLLLLFFVGKVIPFIWMARILRNTTT